MGNFPSSPTNPSCPEVLASPIHLFHHGIYQPYSHIDPYRSTIASHGLMAVLPPHRATSAARRPLCAFICVLS